MLGNTFLDSKGRETEREETESGNPKELCLICSRDCPVRLGILWYSGSLFRESPEVHSLASKVADWKTT